MLIETPEGKILLGTHNSTQEDITKVDVRKMLWVSVGRVLR
jgi:hypothetical protein